MADIKAIKGTDNVVYNLRDDYSKWGGNNLLLNIPRSHVATNYDGYAFYCVEDLQQDVTYTLQLWNVDVSHTGKTADQLGIWVYYCGGNVNFGSWYGTGHFTNGHANHLILTFTPSASNLSHSNVTGTASGSKFIRLYNSVPNASGTKNMSIEKWKLERGHKATDWSPCYKDIFTLSGEQLIVNL